MQCTLDSISVRSVLIMIAFRKEIQLGTNVSHDGGMWAFYTSPWLTTLFDAKAAAYFRVEKTKRFGSKLQALEGNEQH